VLRGDRFARIEVLARLLLAAAGCQLAYFDAVSYMQVGVALPIEFTAPVAVIGCGSSTDRGPVG
jgi:hypothetical protein